MGRDVGKARRQGPPGRFILCRLRSPREQREPSLTGRAALCDSRAEWLAAPCDSQARPQSPGLDVTLGGAMAYRTPQCRLHRSVRHPKAETASRMGSPIGRFVEFGRPSRPDRSPNSTKRLLRTPIPATSASTSARLRSPPEQRALRLRAIVDRLRPRAGSIDRTIPTLRECIIVSHRERRITVHSRGEDGGWLTRAAVAGDRVEVPSVRAELVVDQVYRNSEIR